MAVPGPTTVRVDARVGDGPWDEAVVLPLARDGTYLGFVALDERPRTIDAVRVVIAGAPTFELLDLALVATVDQPYTTAPSRR